MYCLFYRPPRKIGGDPPSIYWFYGRNMEHFGIESLSGDVVFLFVQDKAIPRKLLSSSAVIVDTGIPTRITYLSLEAVQDIRNNLANGFQAGRDENGAVQRGKQNFD